MTVRVVLTSVLLGCVAVCHAADTASAQEKKLTPKEALKARMRAEGRKQPPPNAAANSPAASATIPTGTGDKTTAEPGEKTEAAAKSEKPANTPPTVMPKVEVRNSRITELDQKIAKQERDIAREKEHTRSTEADKALNDPKVSKIFSLFGGESSRHREGIAQERVSLMEAEKDILEAMKLARTKEERARLQKQLDELRAYRRELEKSLR